VTVDVILTVKAASLYHCNVVPLAHEPTKVEGSPGHKMTDAESPAGAKGVGITITTKLAAGLLHIPFTQAA
jgi:hypothetical protein